MLNQEIGLYVYVTSRLEYLLNDEESVEVKAEEDRVSSFEFNKHIMDNEEEIVELLRVLKRNAERLEEEIKVLSKF